MRPPELARQDALTAHREEVAGGRVEERELTGEGAGHDRELEGAGQDRLAADVQADGAIGGGIEDRGDVALELGVDAGDDPGLAVGDHEHPAHERVEDAEADHGDVRGRAHDLLRVPRLLGIVRRHLEADP